MPRTIRRRLPSLLHLLVAVLIPATASGRRGSKQATRQEKKDPVLRSGNMGDVRQFQKRLRTASLEFAKNLLKLFEAVRESGHGSEDPEEIEKRRIELETIEKAQVGPGTAISFLHQNHLARSSKEERGSYRMGCGIQLAKDGSSRANSLESGIIEANRTVLICGARSLDWNRWRVEPIRYNCLGSSLRTC